MKATFIVTSADLEKLKQRARQLKRNSGIPHHQALQDVAKTAGFHHWHHAVESAKVTDVTERAYYAGLLIAMDVKDAQDFRPQDLFVEDEQAFLVCADDMRLALRISEVDDDDVPLFDAYSPEKFEEIFREDMMNYVFFRYAGKTPPRDVADALELVTQCSFWSPQYVWLRGDFINTYETPAEDGRGNIVGVRF